MKHHYIPSPSSYPDVLFIISWLTTVVKRYILLLFHILHTTITIIRSPMIVTGKFWEANIGTRIPITITLSFLIVLPLVLRSCFLSKLLEYHLLYLIFKQGGY